MKFLFLAQFLFFNIVFAQAPLKEIPVGIISNFSELSSSSSNPFGNYFREGVELAIDTTKDELKKKGLKITEQFFDYGTSDIKVLEAARQAVKSNVIATIGYSYSIHAILAGPIHHDGHLPMITPSATSNEVEKFGKYVHQTCFSNYFQGKVLAQFAKHTLKAKRVVTITAQNCAYCQDLQKAFEAEFLKIKGNSLFTIPILTNETDYSNILPKLKGETFDAVLIPDYETDSARIISALNKNGIKKPLLGGDGWGNVGEQFFNILENQEFQSYSLSHWHRDLKTKDSIKFVQEYQKKYSKLPNDTSVLAYDATLILVQAILHSKELNRESIELELNKIKQFKGITGHFNFKLPNQSPDKSIVMLNSKNKSFSIYKVIDPGESK